MATLRDRKKKAAKRAALKAKASEIPDVEKGAMNTQHKTVKDNLEQFAAQHRKEIRSNPQFRRKFQSMCDVVGVDALASQKGFWSELLGIGDFYYDLGVQIVEVCLATRPLNGGLIDLVDLRDRVVARRSKNLPDVSSEDILRAIAKLEALGSGFRVHTAAGGRTLVQSVPMEFNQDHVAILDSASTNGHVSVPGLVAGLAWEAHRARTALGQLVKDGMAWVDDQGGEAGVRTYWFPGTQGVRTD